jgi:CRISPR-associated protein Csd2
MSTTENKPIGNRYDFVYLFDCQDGNPNGDPDADNSPRTDPETFHGLVSDVCLKRKIRDYVLYSKSGLCGESPSSGIEKGYDIYVLAGHALESRQKIAYDHLKSEADGKGKKAAKDDIEPARKWMCQNFFDVRAFGAVMSTKKFNCGQVRGPAQITFSRSIDRVWPTEHPITRVAFTTEEKRESSAGSTEFGRKHTIPYGLYRGYGFINPVFAAQTGFGEDDLSLLWKALGNLFELDRSAARGNMAARGLHIFKHECKLGNAQAQGLFDRILVKKNDGVETPRSFSDYTPITAPEPGTLPPGVTYIDGLALA